MQNNVSKRVEDVRLSSRGGKDLGRPTPRRKTIFLRRRTEDRARNKLKNVIINATAIKM